MSTPSPKEEGEEKSANSNEDEKRQASPLSSPHQRANRPEVMGILRDTQETRSTGLHDFSVDSSSSKGSTSSTIAAVSMVASGVTKPTHHVQRRAYAAMGHQGSVSTLHGISPIAKNQSFSSGAAKPTQQSSASAASLATSRIPRIDMSILAKTKPTKLDPPSQKRDSEGTEVKSPKTGTGHRRKRAQQPKAGQSSGRWTPEEHQAFLEGLKVFGREWKKVAERIPTRTSAQIRSHAQKYFAKLAREESLLLQDQSHSVVSHPHAAVGYENPPGISASLQRSVNRIMANPEGAQREVEDTLQQLRERYRQLQIRLEESNTRRNNQPPGRRLPSRIVEEDPDVEPNSSLEDNSGYSETRRPSLLAGRKRLLEEAAASSAQRNQLDEVSSISSTMSSLSRSRELGNEELIALHVLGGSLSRSSSQQQLEQGPGNDDAASRSSSLTSTHELNDGDSTTSKRIKMAPDQANDNSESDNGSHNDEMVP